MTKPGRPRNPQLAECMRRYGLTKRGVYRLGGAARLERMSEDARQVLLNRLWSERKTACGTSPSPA